MGRRRQSVVPSLLAWRERPDYQSRALGYVVADFWGKDTPKCPDHRRRALGYVTAVSRGQDMPEQPYHERRALGYVVAVPRGQDTACLASAGVKAAPMGHAWQGAVASQAQWPLRGVAACQAAWLPHPHSPAQQAGVSPSSPPKEGSPAIQPGQGRHPGGVSSEHPHHWVLCFRRQLSQLWPSHRQRTQTRRC